MNRGDVKLIIDRCIAHDVPDAADLIERQAAQIEVMREALRAANHACVEDWPLLLNALSFTPDQALEQFATKVREQCAEFVDRNLMGCREYADAIRAIKELPPAN